MPEQFLPMHSYRGSTFRLPGRPPVRKGVVAMTPQERHADAVKAAKQWRDEQRGAPKRGDVITIRWPGGPHDFTMVFDSLDDSIAPHEPGWMFLFGYVGETEVKNLPFKIRDWRTIYARKVEDGVYEMIPHGPSA